MNNPTPPGTEIRTYKLRRSRVSELQAVAISEYGEQYIYPDGDSQIDLAAELEIENFVIEIGFGMGEATWQYANSQNETDR